MSGIDGSIKPVSGSPDKKCESGLGTYDDLNVASCDLHTSTAAKTNGKKDYWKIVRNHFLTNPEKQHSAATNMLDCLNNEIMYDADILKRPVASSNTEESSKDFSDEDAIEEDTLKSYMKKLY